MRQRDRLQQVAELARLVSGGLDPDTLLSKVAAAVRALCPMSLCLIQLVDHDAGGFRLAAMDGPSANGPPRVRSFGQGLTSIVGETRQPLFIRNTRRHPQAAAVDWAARKGLSVYYGVPIQDGETMLGVLNAFFPSHDPPTRQEREAIDLFTRFAAVAIANSRLLAESEIRRSAAEALAEIGRTLSQSVTTLEVAQRVVDSLRQLCGARMCGLYHLDPGSGDLVVLAVSDAVGPVEQWKIPFPPGSGAIGLAVQERRAIVSKDALSDPRLAFPSDARAVIERGPYRAMLAVPLAVGDRVLGALTVRDWAGRVFGAEEIHLAETFADQAAVALRNSQLYEALAERTVRLQTLARLNRLVSSSLNATEVFVGIARAAGELMDAPVVSVWTADEAARTLEVRAFSDARVALDFPARVLQWSRGGVGWVASHRRMLHIPDVFSDERIVALEWWRKHGLTSFLAVPIMLDGSVIGILALNGRRPFTLEADERDLLDTFVAQAAVAFRNVRLFAREQAEAEASEERFHDLVQGVDAIVWEADLPGSGEVFTRGRSFSFVSRRAETVLGYPIERWLTEPNFWERLIHPDDRQRVVTGWRTAVAGGSDYELEYRAVAANGSAVWLNEIGRVLSPGSDPVRRIRGLMVDTSERRRAEEALQARARQQAVVAELGQRALTGTDLAILMSDAVSMTALTLGVEHCKVLELLPEGEAVILRAGVGWDEGLLGHATFPTGMDSQAGYTLLAKEPVVVEDFRTEGRFTVPQMLHDHGVVSGMSVIIQGQPRPFGILDADATTRRSFAHDDVNFLQAVANVLASAIQRKRTEAALRAREEELKELSFKDEVTGLYNRRFFSVRLEEEARRCLRFGHHLSLILLDLDDFKQINDELGHPAGDDILREIGQIVLRHSRRINVLARFGGDEFAILLVETTKQGALHYADRLRSAVSQFRFSHGVRATASFGVASLPDDVTESAEDLVRAADEALYAAKRGGKNMVAAHQRVTGEPRASR